MLHLGWSLALVAVVTSTLEAQRVLLELRPRFGDTLYMRLDQTSEMSGTRAGVATAKQLVTSLQMFSRAIVESSSPTVAIILAVTDSVVVTSTDERARPLAKASKSQLEGRRLRLRLAPDGTVGMADQSDKVSQQVTDLVSVMPASFPRGSVAIGDTWLREMPIPPAPSLGVPAGGVVRAAFRLDSLSGNGDLAFLSLRGTVLQVGERAVPGVGALAGSVSGSMVVNRRRGWLSESRFLLQMRATLAYVGGADTTPMQFRMKITQHMRVIDERR